MKKGDIVADAVETIPQWLAFLEAEQTHLKKALADIQDAQQETQRKAPAGSPLSWLDQTQPPPQDEPQAPTAPLPVAPSPASGSLLHSEEVTDDEDIPLWEMEEGEEDEEDGEDRPW
jgi:hypothetical protein